MRSLTHISAGLQVIYVKIQIECCNMRSLMLFSYILKTKPSKKEKPQNLQLLGKSQNFNNKYTICNFC